MSILATLCGEERSCRERATEEAVGAALLYEAEAAARAGAFRALFVGMSRIPGQKFMVLLSAGSVSSDIPGARPNDSNFGISLGGDAAKANVLVYALFVDQRLLQRNTAENRRRRVTFFERDSNLLMRAIDEVAGASGGDTFKVLSGDGSAAFDRILSETSAYYVLGVRAEDRDRDGRAHQVSVRVKEPKNVSVRHRTWVTIAREAR